MSKPAQPLSAPAHLKHNLVVRSVQVQQAFTQAQTALFSKLSQSLQGFIPDPSGGQIDHSLQADFIQRVVNQAEKGDHIPHFLAAVKALRAHQAVADAFTAEGFFQKTRLRVCAVHDGKITRVLPGPDAIADITDH